MDLPAFLEEQVKAGKVALLLGAGTSLDAEDTHGEHAPTPNQLRDMLADQFLGGKLKNRSLSQIAEYAISESNLLNGAGLHQTAIRRTETNSGSPATSDFPLVGPSNDKL
jgi:hypothetical protein